MESTIDLIEKLNLSDECVAIEAKKASKIHRSILESVCAFSNEPGLGGGYLLLGIERDDSSLFPSYTICGVENPDKIQLDLSSQCADMFNQPIRPEIIVENIDGKNVLNVFIPELSQTQKPVYFKSEGLPKGAFRRIGSSDQRCTDDDLFVFYNTEDSLDSNPVTGASIDDISEDAIQLYRNLRSKVNPYAEELTYNDIELLQSIGCIRKENNNSLLTYTGLLVFGKHQSLRRLLPMVRVDYIRVSGNDWMENPERRFTTIDMRGPLIELVQRTFNAVTDDLPKGFLLPEGGIQANSIGLPSKALREALVNAFIHRTYRENQPIQIIRYNNRLEIKNPGFSLKPEEQLGEPGSKNRNPFIAAIFHETNLAETKGSGIRAMRMLMEKAQLMPPTFESDHSNNQFTVRLLLHHFLNESDIEWLMLFDEFDLTDSQKRALIFLREIGAIDNASHRQLNRLDILRASVDLRGLRDKNIIIQKGKGRSTYYIANSELSFWRTKEIDGFNSAPLIEDSAPLIEDSAPLIENSAPLIEDSAPLIEDSAPLIEDSAPLTFPNDLLNRINDLPAKITDPNLLKSIILELCSYKPMKSSEIAGIVRRSEKYLLRNFITPLKKKGKLDFTHPEVHNHPQQAYRTVTNKE